VLDFLGTEAERRPADTACRSIPPASDALSASTGTAHDDTALCRRRSADSSTSCTSWECVAPPRQDPVNNYTSEYNQSTTVTAVVHIVVKSFGNRHLLNEPARSRG